MAFVGKVWLFVCCVLGLSSGTLTPIVIWHGTDDSSDGLPKTVMKLLQANLDGVYVMRIRIGTTQSNEQLNSFFMHPDIQISLACRQIQRDDKLSDGYHGIGLSQGGLFLRAVAQRCPQPSMKTLVTLGSPHQGVYGLPRCNVLQPSFCEIMRQFLYFAVYTNVTQKSYVPSTYWHDPFNEETFKRRSTFLSDINNELSINKEYSKNLCKLEKFVMVKFRADTVTVPRETQWFEFYGPGQDRRVLPLKESELYRDDKLGLRQMEANGKLVFLEVRGDHLIYSDEWFLKNVVKPYLSS